MIGKIVKGGSFSGLADYLTRDERGEVLEMRHLASDDPTAAASEMQLSASMSRRCKSPVMHISVSYDPGDEQPTTAEMRADAAEILRGLDLEDAQTVIIRHSDRDHAHMHIMANRVGADGRAISDSNSYAKVEKSLRGIEARRGLRITEGRHAPSPTTGARMEGPRTSSDPRQHGAPDSVRDTLLTAKSWPELRQGLARDGWRLETTQQAGKKPGAVLVGPEGQRIGAGKINRAATLSRLQARLDPPKAPAGRAWSGDQARPQPTAAAPRRATPSAGYTAARSAGSILHSVTKIGAGKTRLGMATIGGRKKGKSRRSGASLTSRMGL